MIDYEDVTSALTRLWKGKTKAITLEGKYPFDFDDMEEIR